MKTQLTLTVVVLGLIAACSQEPLATTDSDAERFHAILEAHGQHTREENVAFRSSTDAWRDDGKLAEHTPEARARRSAFNDETLARLETIDASQLSDADRISYDLFLYERQIEQDSHQQVGHFFPFTSLGGYHTGFAQAPGNEAFLNSQDYERYLVVLSDFPRYNGEQIANMREGIARGFTHYCQSIEGYEQTIERRIVEDPRDSELFLPFDRFPGIIDEAEQARLIERGAALIEEQVVPAYQTLLTFFTEEYLPNCRTVPGLSGIPGGDDYYRYRVRYFTTTDMTPEEIHALGLSEVKRIRAEMDQVIESVGFDGSFEAFLEYLRTDPKFYAKSLEELMGRVALICKTAEGELPKLFGLLPRGPYKLQANPHGGASYRRSAGDGASSATYMVAADDLDARPLYTLEALSIHEAVPGHHLQIALALELELPDFRRNLTHGVFVEGWGLYSESLGKEMGFYTDPYSDFGRLTFEAWRAARLVVDTGIHALGWSRQEAVDYLLENTALSELHANKEIDRYITYPAQALSYKIGEIRMRELRAKAETELGSDFDVRGFHDTLLGSGSVPIGVLESIVNEWIESEKQR